MWSVYRSDTHELRLIWAVITTLFTALWITLSSSSGVAWQYLVRCSFFRNQSGHTLRFLTLQPSNQFVNICFTSFWYSISCVSLGVSSGANTWLNVNIITFGARIDHNFNFFHPHFRIGHVAYRTADWRFFVRLIGSRDHFLIQTIAEHAYLLWWYFLPITLRNLQKRKIRNKMMWH